MAKFVGRPGDLKWGKYDYSVTPTQKKTLDGLLYMMGGLPKSRGLSGGMIPAGYFCSQREDTGDVVMGLYHQSVSVHRTGRLTANDH